MSDETPRIKKSRGKGFPVMPLNEAVSAVKQAGRYGREHSIDDYAGFLGHSTSNSGPFKRKMAALKDWGLIERDGSRVNLTPLAIRIAHPDSASDEEEAIRQAFLQEPMFAAVYEEAAKGVELSLTFLAGRAVNAYGVAPVSKERFATSFARSVQAAGLGSAESSEAILLHDDSGPVGLRERGDLVDDDGPVAEDEHTNQSPPRRSRADAPTLHQEWDVPGGQLVFEAHLTKPLPASAYSQVGTIAAEVEKLAAALGRSTENEPTPIATSEA